MRAPLVAAFLLLAGCNPMYVGAPAPMAILHQQHDLSAFANAGFHGFQGGGAYAVTDQFAVRVSGGYRPYEESQNGWGTLGLTSYWAPESASPTPGYPPNSRGLRGAVSLDVGGGSGEGNAPNVNLWGRSTLSRYSGTYWLGQLQADLGYEWPKVALLGSLRGTYFNYLPASAGARSISAGYLEPMLCFRAGPRVMRFELRAGVSIPVEGRVASFGGVQPFIFSAGLAGTFEAGPERQSPAPEGQPPPPPSMELTPYPEQNPEPGLTPPPELPPDPVPPMQL